MEQTISDRAIVAYVERGVEGQPVDLVRHPFAELVVRPVGTVGDDVGGAGRRRRPIGGLCFCGWTSIG
jgi:hypothetical protein